MVSAPAALASDLESAAYGEGLGRNAVALLFRHVFRERLRRTFEPGAHLLDLGCGTGEDALLLASEGFTVHANDVAPATIERVRAEAAKRGLPEERLRLEVRAAEEIDGIGRTFDGAYSGPVALNRADLGEVGRGLERALRPGARVVLAFRGRYPLPALLRKAITGEGETPGTESPQIAGLRVRTLFPTLREARLRLGPAIRWTGAMALGLIVPGPEQEAWACRNPQAFGLLAALEAITRRWPVLRALGHQVVLEGVRR